nr:MAG TPA: CdiI immunity protein [Caudoviricetes sp.]
MRPDAHRWIRPDAARFLLPGTDSASVYPALIPAETKYSPNQPRVPKGNGEESGRWTDGGGGINRLAQPMGDIGINDPRGISDATLDNFWMPGAQLAQNDRTQSYPVDLLEERALGGHTIEGHVGRSSEALLDRVRQEAATARDYGSAGGLRVGSFPSLEVANKLVNSVITKNAETVARVANGLLPRATLDAEFSAPTGYEAYARTERSQPYIRDTYGVRVVIVPDRSVSKGFRIETAFPQNIGR